MCVCPSAQTHSENKYLGSPHGRRRRHDDDDDEKFLPFGMCKIGLFWHMENRSFLAHENYLPYATGEVPYAIREALLVVVAAAMGLSKVLYGAYDICGAYDM